MKFGGTSVGTADAMSKAAQIVKDARAEWPYVVVVASALSGVTNLLLESAAQSAQGNMHPMTQAEQKLRAEHQRIIDALVKDQGDRAELLKRIEAYVKDFGDLCRAIGVLGEASPRALDAVASLGERMSVHVLTGRDRVRGCPRRGDRINPVDSHKRTFPKRSSRLRGDARMCWLPVETNIGKGLSGRHDGFHRGNAGWRHHHPWAWRQRLFGRDPCGSPSG